MSHRITGKRQIGEDVFWAEVEAPLIAAARKPGQFVLVCIDSNYSERIPLTIAEVNREKGTIELIWQRVGKTTTEMADMKEGDVIGNIAGPLGTPTHITRYGTVVCVGGGIGNAPLLPIATALKHAGNRVISILGARDKTRLILEDRFAKVSDEMIVCTDDGSYARKALVTEPLKEVCGRNPKPDHAFIIGPTPMMKFCCEVTRQFSVPTEVLAEHDHGRWHGHVRRLPRRGGRQSQIRLRGRPRIRRTQGQLRPHDQTVERLQSPGATGPREL